MKTKLLFLLLVVFYFQGASISYAQQPPVFEGTFEACKKQAIKENKMILVDLYFIGCAPCKAMSDKVFPDPAVVEVLQPDFLLYKSDINKEEDGMKLSRKYGATGFPTYMILDPSGRTILIESGFFSVDRFVPLLKKAKALRDAGTFLHFDTELEKDYPSAYSARFMRNQGESNREDLESFLEGKDLREEIPFVVSSLVNTPKVNQELYDHLPVLLKRYGGNSLITHLLGLVNEKILNFGKAAQLDSLYATLDYIRPVFNDNSWTHFLPWFVTSYYKGSQDVETYFNLIDKYALYQNWEERSNALGLVIIDQKDNATLLEKLRKEYLDVQKKEQLNFTDQYKLTLLHFYLKDYEQATAGVKVLLESDLSSPEYQIKKSDLESFQAAILKRDPSLFEAKNMMKITPYKKD